MKLLYDMHTHILPNVDDGAKNVGESLNLIKTLKDAGITDICLTPHYYTHKESLKDFLDRRNTAFEELKLSVDNDVKLHLGAEVYITKYLFVNEEDLKAVCYERTRYMLTEFPYSSTFEGESMMFINKLLNNHGITPVLAHVERYPHLLKNLSTLEELIDMGVLIQSNACSFTEFPLNIKLTRMIKNGYIHLIGSDAHSIKRNPPNAVNGFNTYISKKLSETVISNINRQSIELLK